jgi:hypothetical protein
MKKDFIINESYTIILKIKYLPYYQPFIDLIKKKDNVKNSISSIIFIMENKDIKEDKSIILRYSYLYSFIMDETEENDIKIIIQTKNIKDRKERHSEPGEPLFLPNDKQCKNIKIRFENDYNHPIIIDKWIYNEFSKEYDILGFTIKEEIMETRLIKTFF